MERMRHHFVYILRCAGGELYTGYTMDPVKRLRRHNLGLASKYTRTRLPVELVYLEGHKTRSKALRREIKIKRMKRSEKLQLIFTR